LCVIGQYYACHFGHFLSDSRKGVAPLYAVPPVM